MPMKLEIIPGSGLKENHSSSVNLSLQATPLTGNPGQAWASKTDAQASPALKVIFVYENPSAGLRALRKFKGLLRDSYPEVELDLVVWELDRLDDSDWSDIAASAAADADLLVLATSSANSISRAGEKWLASCLALRGGRAITLLAFFGTDAPWTISMEGNLLTPAEQLVKLAPRACAAAPHHEHSFAA